jgi:nucleoprotein TPR
MLVGEMEGVPTASAAAFAPYSSTASASGTMTANQVISDRLVTFKDIQELQEKNAQLLRLVRELSEERETGDSSKQTTDKIKELTKEIEELREGRRRQQTM